MTADATLPASDDLTPEVLARWEEREKTALHRVWTAMGCAPNLDDFKPAVRDQMWDMVVDQVEKDAAKNNRLYHENAELLSGVRSLQQDVSCRKRIRPTLESRNRTPRSPHGTPLSPQRRMEFSALDGRTTTF